MSIQSITISEFLTLGGQQLMLDVRSPGEYAHAHIPGAVSLPLFSDEERARIGIAYKQVSHEQAIKIGLDAFGPKMRQMVEAVEEALSRQHATGRAVLVHCWRGGMRSGAVSWLLDLYGFSVFLLNGGYKAYRQWAISHWQDAGPARILAGYTGAEKTKILAALKTLGEPVLDLEALAQHKGSAFGGLDGPGQPSQEMFENLLATELHSLRKDFPGKAIWIEDESQRIGNLNIPPEFFRTLMEKDRVFLDVSFEQRLKTIVSEYGHHSTERLINAIVRIKKRLGPLETKTAIAHLIEGDIRASFAILLRYYDKHYSRSNASSNSFTGEGKTPSEVAGLLKKMYASS